MGRWYDRLDQLRLHLRRSLLRARLFRHRSVQRSEPIKCRREHYELRIRREFHNDDSRRVLLEQEHLVERGRQSWWWCRGCGQEGVVGCGCCVVGYGWFGLGGDSRGEEEVCCFVTRNGSLLCFFLSYLLVPSLSSSIPRSFLGPFTFYVVHSWIRFVFWMIPMHIHLLS